MVELTGVTKDYGRFRAVSDVSLSISPGEVTGLLGPNGAGKSTIIRMITCLLAPTAGSVTVCGFDTLTQSAPARASIGYLPEFAPLYPEMTAEGYLRFRAGLSGLRGDSARRAVAGSLEKCWLSGVARKRISAMSKGYRQRVGLAGAILHEPKVLILDEPTTGLDPTQIRETRALLRSLAQGRVLLLSSHILPEVEATCDRILVLAQGRLRAQGTPSDLLTSSVKPGYLVLPGRLTTPEQALRFAEALRAIPGVSAVESDASTGPGGLRVLPAPHAPDLREPIAVLAAQQGLLLTELHMLRPSLEEVFMRITQPREASAAAAAGDAA
ncbi:MAG: ABC transporter ATP-binding protein [Phycisphaerales bacterium]|nr:ABC transporter ATP-binding protein [Phycisphaerales bacterium]